MVSGDDFANAPSAAALAKAAAYQEAYEWARRDTPKIAVMLVLAFGSGIVATLLVLRLLGAI